MKKTRIKWKNCILTLVFIIFLIIFMISSINIISWIISSNESKKQINEINKNTNIIEINDKNDIESIIDESKIEESDPYWDYIKTNLISVDFEELKIQNEDTVGWIQVNGTNINYPFVQTNNNTFYLNHSFNKKYNTAGWIFMDYRNSINEFDKNTILYAHGRIDKTMFGSLKQVFNSNWLSNSSNHVIKLSTKKENTLWQVFSIYKILTTNDYLKTKFKTNSEFMEFGNMLLQRSSFDFKTSIDKNDKILTLSTCYNSNEKIVLHAKLIKKIKR